MDMMMRLGALFTAATTFRLTLAIPTIAIKGSKFFDSNGNQFYIKGVAYQAESNLRSLTDGAQCSIDAKLIAQLGANVIRVYTIDPTLIVADCMKAFEDEGIYVLVDMTTPTIAFNRLDPQWTLELRNQFAKVLDGLHEYDNLLGFFAGNEVVNDVNSTMAAPIVKAAIADMKAYRDAMQYRKIPIGYSNNKEQMIDVMANYMDCGSSAIAADFFGFNLYSWCGDSSMSKSDYDRLYDNAEGFDIPIFLSENGCNAVSPRKFSDQSAILGRDMNDRFSGNIIYQWHQSPNNYGLASYPTNSASPSTPRLLADYTYLSSQWATLNPAGVKSTAYFPSLTKRACPTSTPDFWLVPASKGTELPTLGLAGFTTPAGEGGTASATVPPGGTATPTTTTSSSSPSSPPIAAIIGAVLGTLFLLALLTALFFFSLHRRRRTTRSLSPAREDKDPARTSSSFSISSSSNNNNNNNPAMKRPELSTAGGVHELPGRGKAQELDPRAKQVCEVDVAGVRAELGGEGRGWEMDADRPASRVERGTGEGRGRGRGRERERGGDGDVVADGRDRDREREEAETVASESAHVAAQRRREVEWLESEEARIRTQRERLMRRG